METIEKKKTLRPKTLKQVGKARTLADMDYITAENSPLQGRTTGKLSTGLASN